MWFGSWFSENGHSLESQLPFCFSLGGSETGRKNNHGSEYTSLLVLGTQWSVPTFPKRLATQNRILGVGLCMLQSLFVAKREVPWRLAAPNPHFMDGENEGHMRVLSWTILQSEVPPSL